MKAVFVLMMRWSLPTGTNHPTALERNPSRRGVCSITQTNDGSAGGSEFALH